MKISFAIQEFDTDILGFTVAKIIDIPFNDKTAIRNGIENLLKELSKKNIRYITYRVKANDFLAISTLEEMGFLLVDGLISLEINTVICADKKNPLIRIATIKDMLQLEELSLGAFSLTRYYTDPLIKKENADKIYLQWVKNSLTGEVADLVLVHEVNNKLNGFVALQRHGHIPLIAVAEEMRGKGIAKQLIESTYEYFTTWKANKIKIETQVVNVPALRAYISCGFKIVDAYLTFRWTDLK